MSRTLSWVVVCALGAVILLQAVFWNEQRMPIQIPLVTMMGIGIASLFFPALKEWSTKLIFSLGFGCIFLLIWARFQHQFNFNPSRLWIVTVILLCGLLVFLITVDRAVTKERKIPLSLIAIVAFGFMIAMLSGERGNSDQTMYFLRDILGIPSDLAGKINGILRKTIHVVAYGMAAYLTARAVERQKGNFRMAFAAGLAWPIPLCIFDEWNQSRHPTRGASPWDVLLDICGMLLFLGFYWLGWRRRQRSKGEEE